MKIDKKYVMIVTAEDERYGTAGYGLDFFANSPAEGILNDIVYGDDLDELMVSLMERAMKDCSICCIE